MTRLGTACALLAGLCLLLLPAIAPTVQALPPPGSNGTENAFGTLWAPLATRGQGPTTQVSFLIDIEVEHLPAPAPTDDTDETNATDGTTEANGTSPDEQADGTPLTHLLFIVRGESQAIELANLTLATQDGEPIEVNRSEGDPGDQELRLFVDPRALPDDGPVVVLSADATLTANTRARVSGLAIGFDATWNEIQLEDGNKTSLYGFTWIGTDEAQTGGMSPPVEGSGNLVPASPIPLTLLGLAGAALVSRRARR